MDTKIEKGLAKIEESLIASEMRYNPSRKWATEILKAKDTCERLGRASGNPYLSHAVWLNQIAGAYREESVSKAEYHNVLCAAYVACQDIDDVPMHLVNNIVKEGSSINEMLLFSTWLELRAKLFEEDGSFTIEHAMDVSKIILRTDRLVGHAAFFNTLEEEVLVGEWPSGFTRVSFELFQRLSSGKLIQEMLAA